MTATHQPGSADAALVAGASPGTPPPERIDESAYRAIIDSVAQIMWVNDAGGAVRFFNRFGLEYMGRTSAELEGRGWLALIHDDDRSRIAAVRAAAIAEASAYSVEGRFRRVDGAYRWQCFDVQPVRTDDGHIVAWIGSARDIDDERARDGERERLIAALAAQQALFETAYAQAPIGLVIADANGHMVRFNAEAERILGHEPVAANTLADLARYGGVHPDGTTYAAHEYVTPRALAGQQVRQELMRYRRGDGRLVFIRVSGAPVHDAEGRVTHAISTFVDVTEREAAEEALRALAEMLPELVWMADTTGTVDFFNARWEEYTGLRVAELAAGGRWPGTVHPDDEPGMRTRWARSIATGEPYEIFYRLRRGDGAYRWFVGRAAAARDGNGNVTRWFGSCTDIHDEVLGRERLRRLNTVTEALAEALDADAVARIVVREGLGAVGAAAGALAVLADDGRSMQLLGAQASDGSITDTWRRFDVDAPVPMAEVMRTGEPLFLETPEELAARYPVLATQMSSIGVQAAAILPLEWGGRRMGSLAFRYGESRPFDTGLREFLATFARQCAQALERARLYALERRARADAEAARTEAQRANVAKGEFLAMMSHDLRTPINATLGYVDLMAMEIRGPLTEAQRHDLERMRRSQRALLALVNEVLDYTRVEAGRAECRRDPLRLGELVRDVVPIVEALASQKGLRLELAPLPDVIAIGDADRVRQVLLNLLSNAVKFTDAGGHVRLTSDVTDGVVRVHVTDTGRGIPADRLASVFEPFEQVGQGEDRTTREGVGLGLAIARELARAMDGDVTVESEEGVGSTFTLTLPSSTLVEPSSTLVEPSSTE